MSELVSAIITTYKRDPEMLLRAVNSVLGQTYGNIETIIVDDSPSDYPDRKNVLLAISDLIDKGANIQYIQHEENLGACAARNTGMFAAKGTYIAYLDDDDEWLPQKIEKQVEIIQKTNVALVYCGCLCLNDLTSKSIYRKTKFLKGRVFDELLYGNFIDSTSFPLIKLECLKEVGGFDVHMQSAQDFDVWLRITKKYEIDYVDEPLVVYHIHGGEQITSNPIKRINGLERINEKYKQHINSNNKLWWKRNIVITPYYAMNGEKRKALKKWVACIQKRPLDFVDNIRYLRLILLVKNKK